MNPKAAKYGTPVDLGDALRQRKIAEPFILVVGCWRQEGDEKGFVNLIAPGIEPATWKNPCGPVTLADLERLEAVIKDQSLSPAEARAAAQKIKNAPPFTQSIIVVNPKIDSKIPRRLQCSLRFDDVCKHRAPTPTVRPRIGLCGGAGSFRKPSPRSRARLPDSAPKTPSACSNPPTEIPHAKVAEVAKFPFSPPPVSFPLRPPRPWREARRIHLLRH